MARKPLIIVAAIAVIALAAWSLTWWGVPADAYVHHQLPADGQGIDDRELVIKAAENLVGRCRGDLSQLSETESALVAIYPLIQQPDGRVDASSLFGDPTDTSRTAAKRCADALRLFGASTSEQRMRTMIAAGVSTSALVGPDKERGGKAIEEFARAAEAEQVVHLAAEHVRRTPDLMR
jgi:hypothetical protein